jgi:hypothetical protein
MTTAHVTTYFENTICFIIQIKMPIKEDYEFTRNMPENLGKLRKDRIFCDVILRSGLREIYAHRIILTMLSDYFILLFKYEGGFEKPAIEFDENMITGECLERIVDYSYSGKINITKDNVCDLLLAADYFDIRFIKTECETFLLELGVYDKDWINFENLPTLTWFICHLNLSSVFVPICTFISKHFIELRNKQILMSLSPHCLLTLLKHKDMTVFHNGIPVEDIELDLFKFVVVFINEYDLPENIINDLLGTINLSEIQSELFLAVVESCPRIKNNYLINNILIVQSLPSYEFSSGRKYSKLWKHVDGLNGLCDPNIEIDERICSITVYIFCGIPHSMSLKGGLLRMRDRWSSGSKNIENITSISGISITYRSGYIVTIGNTSDEPVILFDKINRHQFTLAEDEIIVKISKNHGTLRTLIFFTNLGNEFDPIGKEFEVDLFPLSRSFGPKGECGYFHSFEKECKIDDLKMLWVEYTDPATRQIKDDIVDIFAKWRQMHLVQTAIGQPNFYFQDVYDDFRHGYVDRYSSYDSDDYDSDNSW